MAKRALLIGINRYRIPGADLRGCVNDVKNIKSVLTKHCGFPANGIKTLTDGKASTQNMEAAIGDLLGKAKRGDVLLLHYSGHGSNVPDKNGDEADFRDEILCPTDLDWKKPLTDDWLRQTFDSLPSGVNLTVIFDCCHSGTATRAIVPPDAPIKERYLPSPWDLVAVESGRSLRGRVRVGVGAPQRKARSGARGPADVVDTKIPELLITGCRDDQTSADAFIRGSYNGALTYHLVAALNAKRGKLSYRDLHTDALDRVRQGRFDQVPQLEGLAANLDRPFLEPF
jgi:hypothetical protein